MNLKNIMLKTVNEADAIIYMLIEDGMTYRDLGNKIGMSHEAVRTRYEKAKKIVEKPKKH